MSLAAHFPHSHERSQDLSPGRLWFPLLAGPLANIAAFMMNLFVLREGCSLPANVTRMGFVALAVGMSVWAAVVAWQSWVSIRDHVHPGEGGTSGRDRFLTLLGLAGSFLGIVLGLAWIPVLLVLDPCGLS